LTSDPVCTRMRARAKRLQGVFAQLLVEHVEDALGGLEQADAHLLVEIREGVAQILLDEIVQFRGELHAGGSAAHHHEVHQALPFLQADQRGAGALEAFDDALADGAGVLPVP
jgi:hypothetical protein